AQAPASMPQPHMSPRMLEACGQLDRQHLAQRATHDPDPALAVPCRPLPSPSPVAVAVAVFTLFLLFLLVPAPEGSCVCRCVHRRPLSAVSLDAPVSQSMLRSASLSGPPSLIRDPSSVIRPASSPIGIN
ncbi:hypothetical protein E4U42_000275, partial [Claviceps africana]